MTREEAIEHIKWEIHEVCTEEEKEALQMAIEALSQEPCDDVVSRKAVLQAVSEGCQEWRGIYGRCEELINELPSVTQKSGKWKQRKTDNTDWWECSECGAVIYSEHEHDMNEYHRFCGRCGAEMESEE